MGLERKVLPGPGSYPGRKGLGFRTEGASGSRFLPREEGFRVWDGRLGELKKTKRVLTSPGSYSGWKGLGFRTEGANHQPNPRR